MDTNQPQGVIGEVPADKATCPHSHLPVRFLKKIGKAAEKVGKEAVETALTIALSNLGAFSED